MRRLAWCVWASLALVAAGSAMGWTYEYWDSWAEVPKKGRYQAYDPVTESYPWYDVYFDDDGNMTPKPDTGDPGVNSALEALALAAQTAAVLNETQRRLENLGSDLKEMNKSIEANKGDIDKLNTVLSNHLSEAGDETSLTNLISLIGRTGVYSDALYYPVLALDEEEDEGGNAISVIRLRTADMQSSGEPGAEPEYIYYDGGGILMSRVGSTGLYTDLIFESAPYSSMVQKSGNAYYNYTVRVDASTHRLVYEQGEKVVFDGGGGTNIVNNYSNCDCTIKTIDDLPPEQDPVFAEWRDGTFADWKSWVDDNINTMAGKIVSLEQWVGRVPISPRYGHPNPGLE